MASYLVDPRAIAGDKVLLTGEEAHHASRVARRKPGERLWLIDGAGTAYEAEVVAVDKAAVECRILRELSAWGEPRARITLAPGLLKGSRFDLVIEKAVELGAMAIEPLECARSVAAGASRSRLARWQALARAAAKQCRRARVPTVNQPCTPRELAARIAGFDAAFVAWEEESDDFLRAGEPLEGSVLLVVGPEGGFTDEETALFREAGGRAVSLGARRLRSETAALCALTLLLDRAGELRPPG